MQKKEFHNLSRLRQALRRLLQDLEHSLEVAFGRSPLVKGNVYEMARKCGKPNCVCTRGGLHRSKVLSWSEGGKTRLFSIPPERLGGLQEESGGDRRGEFDYLEGVGEVSESDFFRAITERKILRKLADTYPSPCQKHDVPLWVYIASDLSMRFHGVHPFHAFPYVVRSGGLVQAFGPQMGHKAVHPETGDVSLRCQGFNDKNEYDRQTPCDPDYLRKMARRTDAQLLQTWFNREVVGIFKQHHAFDAEGIFIGDATYLFVPDNPNYEGSSVMLFDEHNHPVDGQTLTARQRARCKLRRCYKLASLLPTNRAAEFFLYAGLVVTAGQDHECPLLYQLVGEFMQYHGRGVMKRLILDRGLLDGAQIGRCKREFGIDVLIPVRHNMEIYQDVVDLAQPGDLSFPPWVRASSSPQPIPLHRPEWIKKREEARQKTLAQKKAKAP